MGAPFYHRQSQGVTPKWLTSLNTRPAWLDFKSKSGWPQINIKRRTCFRILFLIAFSTLIAATSLFYRHHILHGTLRQNWAWQTWNKHYEILRPEHVENMKKFWKPWADTMKEAEPPISVSVHYKVAGKYDKNYRVVMPEEDIGKNRTNFGDYLQLTRDEVTKLKDAHDIMANKVRNWHEPRQPRKEVFRGRGVVTVSGGRFLGPVATLVRMLRETGSNLPVEIFIPDPTEFEPEVCTLLLKYDARCIVLSDFFTWDTNFELSRYQYKIMAMLFSTFKDVVFLDSDNIPIVDPNVIFDSHGYKQYGFVSWPDFWSASDSPHFWTIAGVTQGIYADDYPPNLPSSPAESGQIVIDKRSHIKTLVLAAYYNLYGPDCWYTLQSQGSTGEGDKTTFETAAYVLGKAFYRVPNPPRHIGRYTHRVKAEPWHHAASLQYMPSDFNVPEGEDPWIGQNPPDNPKPAFLHANWPKFDAGILVQGEMTDLTTDEGVHLRLWGEEKEQVKRLGSDLERLTWNVTTDMACQLQESSSFWQRRGWRDVCERCREHSRMLFEPGYA